MYIMKTEYLIVVVILLFVAFLSTGCSCVEYKPYYKDVLYHQYEPFGLGPVEVTTKGESKKEGFENRLSPEEVANTNVSIDVFSSLPSSKNCNGKSSGLSNSMGPVCLTDTQVKLLQSRGGNATGM
jgi:hypothetical protein